jgi:hypothetical protein
MSEADPRPEPRADDARARQAPFGSRPNAVPAPAAWVALVEVDHRVAQPLLEALEDAGIAAYAEPRQEPKGTYLDSPVPPKPIDRLHVDAAMSNVAEAVVAAELPGLLAELAPYHAELDAFEAIVAAWDAVPEATTWPSAEDYSPTRLVEPPEPPPVRRYEEEHFVPPPPPPSPPVSTVTRWASLAVCLGLFVLVGLPLLNTRPSHALSVVAALSLVGGLATLFWRMRDAPPVDDGPDDGAVV